MKSKILGCLGVILLLSGCAIGPRFRLPEMETPPQFREFKTPVPPDSMADLAWWDVFQDPVLQNLIKEALLNNQDLKIAAARVDEMRSLVGVTRSALLPATDLVTGAERDRNSKAAYPALNRLTSTYTGGFSTAWEVDVWGRIRRQVEAAKADWMAAEDVRKGVIVSLIGDLAQAYFQLRELDLELEIAKSTLETRGDTLKLFEKRFAGGIASRLEITQAEADYRDAAAAIPEIERQISFQENLISYLTGRVPGSIARGKTLGEQYEPPQVPSAGLPGSLLQRRPDLMEAEENLRATNALVGAAMGEFLPKLDMSNFIGGKGTEPKDMWNSTGYTWSIGGQIKFPIFRGGYNYFNFKVAKARWAGARETYKKTALNAFQEVSDALKDIQQYRKIREEKEKQVLALREGAKLSRMRYEGGVSSYLEVLDAERQRFAGENALAKTQGRQLLAYAQLYRVLGGGWQKTEKQ